MKYDALNCLLDRLFEELGLTDEIFKKLDLAESIVTLEQEDHEMWILNIPGYCRRLETESLVAELVKMLTELDFPSFNYLETHKTPLGVSEAGFRVETIFKPYVFNLNTDTYIFIIRPLNPYEKLNKLKESFDEI
jgi:hypothetical protein